MSFIKWIFGENVTPVDSYLDRDEMDALLYNARLFTKPSRHVGGCYTKCRDIYFHNEIDPDAYDSPIIGNKGARIESKWGRFYTHSEGAGIREYSPGRANAGITDLITESCTGIIFALKRKNDDRYDLFVRVKAVSIIENNVLKPKDEQIYAHYKVDKNSHYLCEEYVYKTLQGISQDKVQQIIEDHHNNLDQEEIRIRNRSDSLQQKRMAATKAAIKKENSYFG